MQNIYYGEFGSLETGVEIYGGAASVVGVAL